MTFENDYSYHACSEIISRLADSQNEAYPGYGNDAVCAQAKKKIMNAIGLESAEIFLGVGGTQVNQLVIDCCLTAVQGVIAADTGHIAVHEAGAVEFSGHKVLTLPSHQGKLDPNEIRTFCDSFYRDENHEHMVFPGMIYLSFPTELGTLYIREELVQIREIAKEYNLTVFVDGARLAYGLSSKACTFELQDLAELVDVFTIGGTKCGALFGEAIVFTEKAPKHFITRMKQHGALLAKGWLIGIQYDVLFTDSLYFKLGKQAIKCAEKLACGLEEKGISFYIPPVTNQIFILADETLREKMEKICKVSFWERLADGQIVLRLATSWKTTEVEIEDFLKRI